MRRAILPRPPIGRTSTTLRLQRPRVVPPPSGGGSTTLTYDIEGRVATVVSANGNVAGADPADFRTTKTYDGFGRLVEVADPAGIVSHTDYDVAGHPTASFSNYTDGVTLSGLLNVKTVTVYDAGGRTTSTVVDAGAGNSP